MILSFSNNVVSLVGEIQTERHWKECKLAMCWNVGSNRRFFIQGCVIFTTRLYLTKKTSPCYWFFTFREKITFIHQILAGSHNLMIKRLKYTFFFCTKGSNILLFSCFNKLTILIPLIVNLKR
jgi:hypothetical protein